MTLNLNVPKIQPNLTPRITVVGVGGAGGNAVNNMIQSNLEGVEFMIANTDAQAIQQSLCDRRLQLGRNITQGLGAGARPDIGRAATEEALDEILAELEGANMVFITAGMGGGTGTGGAPVIARAAREAGILTVGVVTKPFHFEGVHRMRMAESGIQELTQYVDTLIVIPNQNLFRIANEKTTFADAFKMADDVLYSGVRGVTDLMVMPGLINLDFADIRSVMTEMGKAMMGTGEAEGDNRSLAAAEAAISNPLLDDVSMKGARGVLINITGGSDMTLFEVDETANRIRDEVDPEANIIFGSTFDASLEGRMRVSVVATGIDAEAAQAPRPVTLSLVSSEAGEQAVQAEPEPEPEQVAEAAEPARLEAEAQPAARAAAGGGAPRNSLFAYSQAVASATGSQPERQPAGQPATAAARTVPVEAERAPQGGGQAEAQDAFIAPPAAEPERVAEPAARSRQADAFAAAALANGSRAPRGGEAEMPAFDRKRAQSLFSRMTTAAKAFQAATHGEPDARSAERSTAAAPRRSEAPAAPPLQRPARTANPAPNQAAQPRLSGLDPAEQAGAASADEDMLDIPAFLRRQAN